MGSHRTERRNTRPITTLIGDSMTEESYELEAMDEDFKHNLKMAEEQVNQIALEMQAREIKAIREEAREACMDAADEQENAIQSAREEYNTFLKGL